MMYSFWPYVIAGFIVFITHMQEGITGFGCTVLALPFLTLLLGLQKSVPLLVVQGWILCGLIVLESHRFICWREYWRILGLAAFGMPLGLLSARFLDEYMLRWILAGFMISVGFHGFWRSRQLAPQGLSDASARGRSAEAEITSFKKTETPHLTKANMQRLPVWAYALLPLGGIFQGAFGTGGPIIVIYAARAMRHKSVFRATLCMLWLTLNTILISSFIASGRLNAPLLQLSAAYLPATLLGLWLGNRAHYRLQEHVFRQIVYAVLMLAGALLIYALLRQNPHIT